MYLFFTTPPPAFRFWNMLNAWEPADNRPCALRPTNPAMINERIELFPGDSRNQGSGRRLCTNPAFGSDGFYYRSSQRGLL